MVSQKLKIKHMPAILWGEDSSKLIIAVHGNCSSKIDDCIWILAEEAIALGYQVLSFDLPRHGERVYETEPLMAQECVRELKEIMFYAKTRAEEISVFGCSIGAYFSLLAYEEESIRNAWFLSPVTDMKRIIQNIMKALNVTEEQLQKEKVIDNPMETLYWEYYSYVKEHPITGWSHPTSILRGELDTLCEVESVSAFAGKYDCDLQIHQGGEHWFHTPSQLSFYREWIKEKLRR